MQAYNTETAAANVTHALTMHGYASQIAEFQIPSTTFVDVMSRHGVNLHISSPVCELLILWVMPQSF